MQVLHSSVANPSIPPLPYGLLLFDTAVTERHVYDEHWQVPQPVSKDGASRAIHHKAVLQHGGVNLPAELRVTQETDTCPAPMVGIKVGRSARCDKPGLRELGEADIRHSRSWSRRHPLRRLPAPGRS